MKRIVSLIFLGIALLTFIVQPTAWGDSEIKGSKIFSANCAACHINGNNVVIASKTLKKDALIKYLKGFNEDPQAAIIRQVTFGKSAMPAFNKRLTSQEIQAVATFVAEQAEKGW